MKAKLFQVRLGMDHAEKDQEQMNNFLDSITVKRMSTDLVNGESDYWSVLVFYETQKGEDAVKIAPEKVSYPADTVLDTIEQKFFNALKQWRYEKAEELRLPPFMICSNAELVTVVKVKPRLFDDFRKIKGFGMQKIAKFSDEMLAVIHSV